MVTESIFAIDANVGEIGDEDLALALGEAAQVPTADRKAVVEQLAAVTVTRYLPPSSV